MSGPRHDGMMDINIHEIDKWNLNVVHYKIERALVLTYYTIESAHWNSFLDSTKPALTPSCSCSCSRSSPSDIGQTPFKFGLDRIINLQFDAFYVISPSRILFFF